MGHDYTEYVVILDDYIFKVDIIITRWERDNIV